MTLLRNLTGTTPAGGDATNVEDVFSTYLYTGTHSLQDIENGIDLDGEGGMVWIKNRTDSQSHAIIDTERGATKALVSDNAYSEDLLDGGSNPRFTFNSNGFSINGNVMGDFFNLNAAYGGNGEDYASWTFRKAPRFFDVVTYTGNGTSGHEIAHDLGCEVGMMVVKKTNGTNHWTTYHRSADATAPEDKYLRLNTTEAVQDYVGMWNDTAPTSSAFTVGNDETNNNGGEYVAYIFAHDPDGTSNDGMIACGSFIGPGNATDVEIDLGWEPQYVMIKKSSSTGHWYIFDVMRGLTVGSYSVSNGDVSLGANLTTTDDPQAWGINPTATGFTYQGNNVIGSPNQTAIYMAIRAPMMVEPEAGTEVFAIDTGTMSDGVGYTSNFPVDMAIKTNTNGDNPRVMARLTGANYMQSSTTSAESSDGDITFDHQHGWSSYPYESSIWYSWMFKRAKGFFDVVAYTGNSTAGRTVNHSLGVVPEMMWVKARNGDTNWNVYSNTLGTSNRMYLNSNGSSTSAPSVWYETPTSTEFSLNTNTHVNYSGYDYIAYLFATLDGVSKVGSYTGNGSSQNIDCGFSGGARFVLIKRTDSAEEWFMFDTARGIVSGNDSVLFINNTNPEITSSDHIDPYSAGFALSGDAELSGSGKEFIFLAIA